METPQINPLPEAGKSQAGTNLAIVILVLVIVVVGVKLLMSGTPVGAPGTETSNEEVTNAEEITPGENGVASNSSGQNASVAETLGAVGKGMALFTVYSPNAVVVRTIEVWNPFKENWVVVYDGYKSIGAGQTVEVFKASLAALTYDQVRVRVLNSESGEPMEFVKESPVTVTVGATATVKIDL